MRATRADARLSRDDIESAVRAATLAPSVLNIQPWRFVASERCIEIHLDRSRGLPEVDPVGRALTISCGAALFNLELAIAVLNRRPEVRVFAGRSAHATMLATVTPGDQLPPTADERRMHDAIRHRRTTRTPYLNEPLPPELVVRLEDGDTSRATVFRILDQAAANAVADVVREADTALCADLALRAEVARWITTGSSAVDGVPQSALGPLAREPGSLVRDFAMGAEIRGRRSADFEGSPTVGVLFTRHDDPGAWLAAGQRLERVWLEATAAGAAISLMSQPMEVLVVRCLLERACARALARHPAGAQPLPLRQGREEKPLWPQMVLRMGVSRGHASPTPRRPLNDVLTFV